MDADRSGAPGLLAGLRVLDLTDEKGSPVVWLLAGFGADIEKIEPPGGSPERGIGPFAGDIPHPDRSLRFWYYDTNRRSRVLDLDSAAGVAALRDLAAVSDVLIESQPPGYLPERDLGYDELRSANPRLVQVSITPFGQTGPWRDYQTTDLIAWLLGGPGSICGLPGRPPIRPAGLQTYSIAGSYAAIAALAALQHRDATGAGQHVDVSVHEAIASLAESTVFFWQGDRQAAKRFGSQHPTTCPIDVYPTRDGYAYLNCLPAGQWRALVAWLTEYEPAGELADPKYDDSNERIRDREMIEARISNFLAGRARREVFERGQAASIPAAYLARPDDILADPHLNERGFFQRVASPLGDHHLSMAGPPVRPKVGGVVRLTPAPTLPAAGPATTETEPGRRVDRTAPAAGQTAASASPHTDTVSPGGATPPEAPPLRGIRIIDLTWVWAGPFGTAVLAELGADVIKVEPPAGDINRTIPAFAGGVAGVNRGIAFAAYNRNKRSVRIDARTPAGRAVLLDLVRHADVVVENFSAGTLERLGFGYTDLATANPRIILARLAGFGQTGPYANYVSYAPTLHALAGLTGLSGYPDGRPVGSGIALGDFQGGLFGAVAILAALRYRERTGEGQEIDLSQFEVVASLLGPALLDAQVNGRTSDLNANRATEWINGPHGVYPARGDDRWVAIAVTNDAEWESFRRILGSPDWTRDARFATGADRHRNAADLDELVATWTRDRDDQDIMTALQKAGVPAGVVQDGRDLLEADPQLAARGFFVPADHPEVGRLEVARNPMVFSASETPVRRAGPLLGEHTEEVLREVLDYSDADLARLAHAGAILPAVTESAAGKLSE